MGLEHANHAADQTHNSIVLFSPPSAGLPVTAAFTMPNNCTTCGLSLSQYSADSVETLISAMPSVSSSSGNQAFSNGFHSSFIFSLSCTVSARPLSETHEPL